MRKFIATAATACASLLIVSPALCRRGNRRLGNNRRSGNGRRHSFTLLSSAYRFVGERRADQARGVHHSGGVSLGDALKNVPGVTSSSFTAGASRPVIRGLGSTRVRVTENGLGSHDVSDVSDDHARARRSPGCARNRDPARARHLALREPGDRRRRELHQQPHSDGDWRRHELRSLYRRFEQQHRAVGRRDRGPPQGTGRSTPTASFVARMTTTRPTERSGTRSPSARASRSAGHISETAAAPGAWASTNSSRITASRRSPARRRSRISTSTRRTTAGAALRALPRLSTIAAQGVYTDYTHSEIVDGEGVALDLQQQGMGRPSRSGPSRPSDRSRWARSVCSSATVTSKVREEAVDICCRRRPTASRPTFSRSSRFRIRSRFRAPRAWIGRT